NPMSMPRFAWATGTLKPAAMRTIAAKTPRRLRNDRLPSEGRQHAAQSVFELDFRIPAEELLRTRDVGLTHLRIVDRQRLMHDLARRTGDTQHRLRELVQRELARVAEVHREVLLGFRERDEAADEVVHVTKASCLRAVTEHGQGLALEG